MCLRWRTGQRGAIWFQQRASVSSLWWQTDCVSVWLTAQALRQNCESSRASCRSIRFPPCPPHALKDRNSFFYVWPPSSFFFSASVSLSLSTCLHLIITFLFICLSFFFPPPRLMQTGEGDLKLQQSREEIVLFSFSSNLVPDNAATKYYHHLLYFHNWILFGPERPQPLLL